MAKNMYQKREERKEKCKNNVNNNAEGCQKTVINWQIPTYGKLYINPYK